MGRNQGAVGAGGWNPYTWHKRVVALPFFGVQRTRAFLFAVVFHGCVLKLPFVDANGTPSSLEQKQRQTPLLSVA